MVKTDAVGRAARKIQRATALEYDQVLSWVRQNEGEIREVSVEQRHRFEDVALELFRSDES